MTGATLGTKTIGNAFLAVRIFLFTLILVRLGTDREFTTSRV